MLEVEMKHSKSLQYLNLEQRDAVLLVQLDRASKRNALNDACVLELEQVFQQLPSDVRAVVIYGAGDHFCAGLDLSELTERDAAQGVFHSRMWHRALEAIQYSAAPVVAMLHGAVVGGGLELACAAHIRVAEASTFYALPEGQRGIYVGGGASVRVPKLIGVARMTDMMLTGRVVDATEGERIGLAQYLVATGAGLAQALKLAEKIASNTPMTNFALTNVLPRIAESNQDQGLMLESLIAAIAQSAPEAKHRLELFLNKRAKKVGEE
jgi:(methylthio)acryloyl-CoA hydratase